MGPRHEPCGRIDPSQPVGFPHVPIDPMGVTDGCQRITCHEPDREDVRDPPGWADRMAGVVRLWPAPEGGPGADPRCGGRGGTVRDAACAVARRPTSSGRRHALRSRTCSRSERTRPSIARLSLRAARYPPQGPPAQVEGNGVGDRHLLAIGAVGSLSVGLIRTPNRAGHSAAIHPGSPSPSTGALRM